MYYCIYRWYEKKLDQLFKGLKFGIKVNDSKLKSACSTVLIDNLIEIKINGFTVISNLPMKVLGVIFDSKLQWGH